MQAKAAKGGPLGGGGTLHVSLLPTMADSLIEIWWVGEQESRSRARSKSSQTPRISPLLAIPGAQRDRTGPHPSRPLSPTGSERTPDPTGRRFSPPVFSHSSLTLRRRCNLSVRSFRTAGRLPETQAAGDERPTLLFPKLRLQDVSEAAGPGAGSSQVERNFQFYHFCARGIALAPTDGAEPHSLRFLAVVRDPLFRLGAYTPSLQGSSARSRQLKHRPPQPFFPSLPPRSPSSELHLGVLGVFAALLGGRAREAALVLPVPAPFARTCLLRDRLLRLIPAKSRRSGLVRVEGCCGGSSSLRCSSALRLDFHVGFRSRLRPAEFGCRGARTEEEVLDDGVRGQLFPCGETFYYQRSLSLPQTSDESGVWEGTHPAQRRRSHRRGRARRARRRRSRLRRPSRLLGVCPIRRRISVSTSRDAWEDRLHGSGVDSGPEKRKCERTERVARSSRSSFSRARTCLTSSASSFFCRSSLSVLFRSTPIHVRARVETGLGSSAPRKANSHLDLLGLQRRLDFGLVRLRESVSVRDDGFELEAALRNGFGVVAVEEGDEAAVKAGSERQNMRTGARRRWGGETSDAD